MMEIGDEGSLDFHFFSFLGRYQYRREVFDRKAVFSYGIVRNILSQCYFLMKVIQCCVNG